MIVDAEGLSLISAACPCKVHRRRPEVALHTLMTLSSEPVNKWCPVEQDYRSLLGFFFIQSLYGEGSVGELSLILTLTESINLAFIYKTFVILFLFGRFGPSLMWFLAFLG